MAQQLQAGQATSLRLTASRLGGRIRLGLLTWKAKEKSANAAQVIAEAMHAQTEASHLQAEACRAQADACRAQAEPHTG
ncbi:hypothetical protein EVAR_34731_1 [Eumeta japonica]|uniref:Uncharacterized protein n=1 Tax=Eumeta variegata TaxID=151549 RepID=A0A4C1XGB4_EUMVA|nr:hypothetical protein EVAR_34731_1 [Eumeta japonica]